jgi:hypothetical protein
MMERKRFFFEKKKQKTFDSWRLRMSQRPMPRVIKVFCRAPGGAPFFQKSA